MKKKVPTSFERYPEHDTVVVEMLRKDPEFAVVYLNDVLKDGDQEEFMLAIRRIADAFGGIPELARRTNLHPKTLYRTLSEHGNPRFDTIASLLDAIGMRISVSPKTPKPKSVKSPVKVPTRGRAVARV